MKSREDGAFALVAPKLWNDLPLHIREVPSPSTFKKLLKTYLFACAFQPGSWHYYHGSVLLIVLLCFYIYVFILFYITPNMPKDIQMCYYCNICIDFFCHSKVKHLQLEKNSNTSPVDII